MNSYRAAYKTDSYVGSLGELERAVDAALSQGLPIVAAVHSAASRHHWIVVVGRDANGGYLAVGPGKAHDVAGNAPPGEVVLRCGQAGIPSCVM